MFCQEQLGELRDKKDLFSKSGATLVVIGQGDPEMTQTVCEEYGAWYQCLSDPKRESYLAYGISYTSYAELTTERVKQHFAGICKGEVVRYELPNLLALNFILHDSLGGGGSASLITDAQGKTHGLALLRMEIEA